MEASNVVLLRYESDSYFSICATGIKSWEADSIYCRRLSTFPLWQSDDLSGVEVFPAANRFGRSGARKNLGFPAEGCKSFERGFMTVIGLLLAYDDEVWYWYVGERGYAWRLFLG
jgi:hypothetical protein